MGPELAWVRLRPDLLGLFWKKLVGWDSCDGFQWPRPQRLPG